jgi:hypothetical protein
VQGTRFPAYARPRDASPHPPTLRRTAASLVCVLCLWVTARRRARPAFLHGVTCACFACVCNVRGGGGGVAAQRRARPPFVPALSGPGDTQLYDLYPDTEAVDEVEKDKWNSNKRSSPSRSAIFSPSDFATF